MWIFGPSRVKHHRPGGGGVSWRDPSHGIPVFLGSIQGGNGGFSLPAGAAAALEWPKAAGSCRNLPFPHSCADSSWEFLPLGRPCGIQGCAAGGFLGTLSGEELPDCAVQVWRERPSPDPRGQLVPALALALGILSWGRARRGPGALSIPSAQGRSRSLRKGLSMVLCFPHPCVDTAGVEPFVLQLFLLFGIKN